MQKTLGALTPIFMTGVVAFLVVPIFVAASVSFTSGSFMTFPPVGFSWRWYENIISAENWHKALLDTLLIGAISTFISTTAGTFAAYGISRIANPLRRNGVLVIFLAPLAVPYVSFGMSLYPIFATYRLIGTPLGVALAQSVIAMPFVVLAVLSTIRRRDRILEAAGRTLGASPIRCFRHIVLPLLAPGILAGAILAFMTSFDDVIMPIFIGGARVATIPKVMLNSLTMTSDPSVMAASTIVSTIGLAGFLIAGAIRRRRAT